MAILTVAVSMTMPTLGHFFSGRALNSEARRLLALTRNGQSRAVYEGLAVELWIDARQRKYGLEAEGTSGSAGKEIDSKAVDFELDRDVKIEVPNSKIAQPAAARASTMPISTASVPPVVNKHPNLPVIRFLPDGSVSESSPPSLHLIDRDGASLWVALSKNKMHYEIRSQNE
jgi:hypothetical protein